MIKLRIYACKILLIGIFGLLFSNTIQAQFIDLNLEVNSKLTAHTERPLNFGTVTTNSGQSAIDWGSPNMGIFSIRAIESLMLVVTLDLPNELYHEEPDIDTTIPLDLNARYGYSTQNFESAIPLPGATSYIRVETNSDSSPWNTLYLFIYGTITIGDIPEGVYDNQIVLNVEYI